MKVIIGRHQLRVGVSPCLRRLPAVAPAERLQLECSAARGLVGSPSRMWPASQVSPGLSASVCPHRQQRVSGLALAVWRTSRARRW